MTRLLVSLDQDVKLETAMKMSNMFLGLAEYSAISMEGVKCLYKSMRHSRFYQETNDIGANNATIGCPV
jgi:hypothetical protein